MVATTLRLLFLVACASCGSDRGDLFAPLSQGAMSYEEADAFLASLPYGTIVLDHQPYFMASTGQDQFRVEFLRDGTATLHGRVCGSEWGDFVGSIDLWEYGRLCELLSTTGIESLEDKYDSGTFHGGTYILTLGDDEGRVVKEINDYGNAGPNSFWAVKCAIEAVMNRTDWEPLPAAEEPSNNAMQTDAAPRRH